MSAGEPVISDLQLRAYFASVIGPARAPYGLKSFKDFVAGRFLELAQNSTKNKVLRVTVSRADILTGGTVVATFTKNSSGASSNDFTVSFAVGSAFPFILYPDESLSLSSTGTMQIVVAQETY